MASSRQLGDWQRFTLDSLLASGILSDGQLDGMTPAQLCHVASAYVVATSRAEPFDAEQAVEQAMRQRYRVRTAA